jgi:hypothetical protein
MCRQTVQHSYSSEQWAIWTENESAQNKAGVEKNLKAMHIPKFVRSSSSTLHRNENENVTAVADGPFGVRIISRHLRPKFQNGLLLPQLVAVPYR